MDEDNSKLEEGLVEPLKEENKDIKKSLYSYSADDDNLLNMLRTQNNTYNYNDKYKYEYSNEIRNDLEEVKTSKSDVTFILCVIAGWLNFIFGFLFLAFNFRYITGGISAIGLSILISDNTIDIILVYFILFVLFIASFVFLYVYKMHEPIGIFGIIVCCLVCLLCLFIEYLAVVVQLTLYIVAIVMFFSKYMQAKRVSY